MFSFFISTAENNLQSETAVSAALGELDIVETIVLDFDIST